VFFGFQVLIHTLFCLETCLFTFILLVLDLEVIVSYLKSDSLLMNFCKHFPKCYVNIGIDFLNIRSTCLYRFLLSKQYEIEDSHRQSKLLSIFLDLKTTLNPSFNLF